MAKAVTTNCGATFNQVNSWQGLNNERCSKKVLERLETADWFSEAGKRNVDNAIVVSSWEEAVERCNSPEWEAFTLEAQNQLTVSLTNCCRERYREWNNITKEVKSISVPLVIEKTMPVVEQHNLPEDFVAQVQ